MDKFVKWADSNFSSTEYCEEDFEDEFSAIIIREHQMNITIFESNTFFEIPNEQVTIGSGSLIAKTAMLLGKTAEEAIVVASQIDSATNSNITTVKFNKPVLTEGELNE